MSEQRLSEAESKELVAKGRLLRALLYKQARTMGRFVWVDRVLAPADTTNNGLMYPTTKSTTESYTYILDDIKAAIPDLPVEAKSGDLSRNVAYTFQSEIALQAAAYETDPAQKKTWLKEAVAAADGVEVVLWLQIMVTYLMNKIVIPVKLSLLFIRIKRQQIRII